MYKINYLEIALQDLDEITTYMQEVLKSSSGVENFITQFDEKVSVLKEFPYAYKVYTPVKPLDFEYRMISVNNYLVFYVVKEQAVEIHRVIYGARNLDNLIR